MGSGRPRTFEDLAKLVALAGFENPSERRTSLPLLVRMLVAQKPNRSVHRN